MLIYNVLYNLYHFDFLVALILASGEGDQELFDSSHPVLRTSSLKHQRAVPHSRYTHNRRSSGPVLSMQEEKSLGDAKSVGFGEMQQAEFMELETTQADHVKDMVMPDNNGRFLIDCVVCCTSAVS